MAPRSCVTSHDRPDRNSRRAVRTAIFGLVAFLVFGASTPSCGNFKRYRMGNDWFLNYDLHASSEDADEADWPVSFIFYGPNATVGHVNSVLSLIGFPNRGGDKYELMFDGGEVYAAQWDHEPGRKSGDMSTACGHSGLHVRVYGDPWDDHMWAQPWDKYVFATVHWDVREGCSTEVFGYSENAEYLVANRFAEVGFGVARDYWPMENRELNRLEGRHYWSSDGYATVVHLE